MVKFAVPGLDDDGGDRVRACEPVCVWAREGRAGHERVRGRRPGKLGRELRRLWCAPEEVTTGALADHKLEQGGRAG